MKDKRIWILLGLGVLVAAFLLLDFRAAVSNTQAEHNIITTSSGDQLPEAMQFQGKLTVAVVGEGPLARALRKAIPAEMSKAGLGGVELVEQAAEAKPAYENPVLVIYAGQPGVIWTPVFATSQLTVEAGYASNGDTTFMGDTPIVYNSKDGPTINMSAEYKVKDSSWGVISLPGYNQLLADKLAQDIVAAIRKLYEGKTP